MVNKIRTNHKHMGGKKLHDKLLPKLEKAGIKCGRDKFFDILREENLLVRYRKRFVKTTQSKHQFYKYPNLISKMEVSQSERVFVSDITYIRTKKGFMYLFLITDLYSKQIMGWELSDNMRVINAIKALKMALKNRKYPNRKLIHHSDRGIQYCSDDYIQMLMHNKISISMTENSDPYENSIAERVNGILKQEFSIGEGFINHLMALHEVKKSIYIYNHKRPHRSCKMLTPEMAHLNGKYKLPSYSWKNKQKNQLSLENNS